MEFINPYALLAILIIPLMVGILIFRTRATKSEASGFVKVGQKSSSTTSLAHTFSFIFFMLSLFLMVIALARPYMGKTNIDVPTNRQSVFLLIDASTSMLCNDVSLNRTEAAIAAANTIIEHLPNAEFGLGVYSETLALMSPYTEDTDAIITELRNCRPNIQQPTGSDMGRAVSSTLELLSKVSGSSHSVVLLTDGEKHDSNLTQAEQLAKTKGIQVHCIGIGTIAGGTIPDSSQPEKKFHDNRGKIVYTSLEPDSLRQLAKISGGIYTTSTNSGIKHVIKQIKSQASNERMTQSLSVPNEKYAWFLLPSLFFLLLGAFFKVIWRSQKFSMQPAAALPLLFIAFSATFSYSAAAEGSLAKAKQQLFDKGLHIKSGRKALKKKEYKNAISEFKLAAKSAAGNELAEINFAIGDAYTQLEEHSTARKHFSKALLHKSKNEQVEASYNLGNALFLNKWKNLKPPQKVIFKNHLTQNIFLHNMGRSKETTISLADIQTARTEWTDAILFYRYAHDTEPSHKASADNLQTVKNLLKDIEDSIIEGQKKAEEEKKKNEDIKKDQPDKKNKNGQKEDDNPGDGSESQQEPNNGSESENPQGEAKPNENGDPKGENETKSNSEQNTSTEKGDNDDPDQTSEELNNDPNSKPKENEEFTEKKGDTAAERARKILKRTADQEINPLRRQLGKPYRSDKDW